MGDIFILPSFVYFCSCYMNEGLPEGTREKKVLGNTGTKHSFVTGRTKRNGKKRRNRHLSCDIFFSFFQSVFMELRQRLNWGMSICYESTLGNWMLSKINKKLVGNRNTVKLQ